METNNRYFFRPLISKNSDFYIACILDLIHFSNLRIAIPDGDARNQIAIFIHNTNISYEIEDENGIEPVKKTANDIIRYFRLCGWVSEKELSRNGEYETYVTILCRKLIPYINNVINGFNSGSLSSNIFTMHLFLESALNNDLLWDRPYTNILKPLSESMNTLRENLFILNKSVYEIMRIVMDTSSLDELGSVILGDELMNKFFRDYYYIKQNGTIPSIISKINDNLRKLQNSQSIEKFASEYSQINEMSKQEASESVSDELFNISTYITYDYQETLDEIETQINSYQELLHTRLILLTGNSLSLENLIDRFFHGIKNIPEEKQEIVFNEIGNCFKFTSQKFIGIRSLTSRRKKKMIAPTESMDVTRLSEEEEKEWLKEIEIVNVYGLDSVTKFVDTWMNGRNRMELKYEPIKTREHVQMFVAAIAYSTMPDFPFSTEFLDETADFGFVEMRNTIFERKELQ